VRLLRLVRHLERMPRRDERAHVAVMGRLAFEEYGASLSSLKRLASTQPVIPAPTITKPQPRIDFLSC